MRRLLNTLFILTEDAYLALENENVVVKREDEVLGRVPLLTLENILYFGYKGASPFLMGECAKRGIGMCFLSPHATRQILSQSLRRESRQCVAEKEAIPYIRR